jgi:hypothetical protein
MILVSYSCTAILQMGGDAVFSALFSFGVE